MSAINLGDGIEKNKANDREMERWKMETKNRGKGKRKAPGSDGESGTS